MTRLLQLSDCHLPPRAGELFRGQDVDRNLTHMVEWLQEQYPPFDHLLLTGDLVHHGGPDAYHRLLRIVAPLGAQLHWIPGNHDQPEAMQHVDADGCLSAKVIHSGNWTLLLLDSTAEPDGYGSGSLSPAECVWLEQQLTHWAARSVLLVLHHNPAPTGSRWQDAIRLGNPDRLAALIEQQPQVRGVLCGHVHQAQTLSFAGHPLWAAPSTSVQFRAGCDQCELETEPQLAMPGGRWYQLQPDGAICAHLLRLPQGYSR